MDLLLFTKLMKPSLNLIDYTHSKIQFTSEVDQNLCLNFLQVSIMNQFLP